MYALILTSLIYLSHFAPWVISRPFLVLPILSVLTIRKPKVEGRTFSDCAVLALSSAVSFAVGMYDGFFGPGTGMLLTLGFSFNENWGSFSACARANSAIVECGGNA